MNNSQRHGLLDFVIIALLDSITVTYASLLSLFITNHTFFEAAALFSACSCSHPSLALFTEYVYRARQCL